MGSFTRSINPKGIEVYVDADFAGGWSSAGTEDADNVLS